MSIKVKEHGERRQAHVLPGDVVNCDHEPLNRGFVLREWDYDGCPTCGADIMYYTCAPEHHAYDDDEWFCSEGHTGCMVVNYGYDVSDPSMAQPEESLFVLEYGDNDPDDPKCRRVYTPVNLFTEES